MHDIQGFADLLTSDYRQLVDYDGPKGECKSPGDSRSTMMGLKESANRLGTHAHTCESCVGKYYTSNFVDIRLQTTSQTMMGLEGSANCLGSHACTCESCVRKYYTSNFVRIGDHLYDSFNNRFLIMSYMSYMCLLDNGSPTSANLGNDHGFISE